MKNKTYIPQTASTNTTQRVVAGTALVSLALLGSIVPVNAETYAALTGQIDVGQSGTNVRNLQLFLAANGSIYPEGLVTGYYGSLTQAAVVRFQNTYGLDPAGRVGPLTLSKINSMIALGGWTTNPTDAAGPWISAGTVNTTGTSATFAWVTNENATAKVFYNTSPIMMNEGDINSVGFGSTNGSTAVNDNLARTSHQIMINNLQPNTTYYYVVVSTDLSGNVSVWNPNGTFRTTQ